MGTWSPGRVRRTASSYAVRMRRLGVRMDLAPVVDLAVPGHYIDELGRSFGADPDLVAGQARAWRVGMQDGGVVTVLKHWPGHGGASNSHTGPARTAPLSQLETADLVPFDRALADGAPVVMVGHLLSRGLTRRPVALALSGGESDDAADRALALLATEQLTETLRLAVARLELAIATGTEATVLAPVTGAAR